MATNNVQCPLVVKYIAQVLIIYYFLWSIILFMVFSINLNYNQNKNYGTMLSAINLVCSAQMLIFIQATCTPLDTSTIESSIDARLKY
jgi:hypothetical protein